MSGDNGLTVAQQIARAAYKVQKNGLAPELRAVVTRNLLDTIGNSLAALQESPAKITGELVSRWGGAAEALALGLSGAVPAPSAALVNGTLAHTLDFDDTHMRSILHPSASVIPAVLAVAQRTGASGTQALDAIGIGLEIVCRLGLAGNDAELGNNIYFERGLHATSICGAIGSAIAAGMILNLDEGQLASTIGVAASMGAGILEANRTGGTIKRAHCGWAAHSGVIAAELTAAGLTGPPTVIEGRFGFLTAYCGDRWSLDPLLEGLGEKWVLHEIGFKPYPCNGFTHPGIDAALRLRARGVLPNEIETVTLGFAAPVLRTIAEPREAKIRPSSGYHAAFSAPFTFAAALIGGEGLGLGHQDFTDEMARNPERLALAEKVICVADAECEENFPGLMSAVMTATLRSGEVIVEKVRASRGGMDNFLSNEELLLKFRMNAARALEDSDGEKIAQLITALPETGTVKELMGVIGDAIYLQGDTNGN